MTKKLLSITFMLTVIAVNAQSFSLMYPFSSVVTSSVVNTGTLDPTPTPTATGITSGSFTAVGTPTGVAASGVFAFSGWETGATNGNDIYSSMTGTLNPAKYYDISISPTVGMSITLTDITFNMLRSSTGPRTFAWRSNKDGFVANLPASVLSNTNLVVQPGNVFMWAVDSYTTNTQQKGAKISLSGANFTNQTTPYNFRLYIYNAEAAPGTFRIDTVIINGIASISTGIGSVNFDLNSNFNVYPVPSIDGVLYIENKNATEVSKIELMDVLGNIILTSHSTNESKIKLNLADLQNGNYFVKISSGKNITVKKIVVVK